MRPSPAGVRKLLDDGQARLASEEELVFAYPMYKLGAVPPFGVPAGDRVEEISSEEN